MTHPADVAGGVQEDATTSAILTVLRISRVMERIDAGVSPQQYRMLKLIGAGGERSARLAEKLAVARPTLTSTADSLVAAGLAYREAEPGDRRVVRLRLTTAGLAAVERADQAYRAWFDSLLEHTGRRDEILADFLLLDESMTERRRARLAADADKAQNATDPAAGRSAANARAASTRAASSRATDTRAASTSAGQP
ncbi:MAG TPA: MarR family transcriptional regulator [Streptosporangiaceae bacterium]|nr:MarR family transcriptional regulator [Streptosporangiaceae bacterium]